MFLGFLDEGVAATLPFVVRDANLQPVEPDAAPTWRLYGANGVVASGTGTAASFETGSVTDATDASPIVITSASHPLSTGQRITVSGVGGNTGANGTFIVTAVSGNTFSLDGSTGTGAYTSGGTWKTTGLYGVTLSGAVLNSLEAGKTYTLVVYWTVSGASRSEAFTLTVQ